MYDKIYRCFIIFLLIASRCFILLMFIVSQNCFSKSILGPYSGDFPLQLIPFFQNHEYRTTAKNISLKFKKSKNSRFGLISSSFLLEVVFFLHTYNVHTVFQHTMYVIMPTALPLYKIFSFQHVETSV